MRETVSQDWIAVGFVALVLVSATGGAMAAASTNTQQAHDGGAEPPAFVVTLQENGSATVTVSYAYNLSDVDLKAAFEDLRNSTDARDDFRDRFESRFRSVANNTANATDREMSVGNATLEFRTEGDTGVVTATVLWDGLAAVDGEQVTLTEPFSSGFSTERAFHVVIPDSYTVSSVTPSPDQHADGHLIWTSGADLNGFELVITTPEETETATPMSDIDTTATGSESTTESESTTGETAGSSGPGFGVVAVVAALVGLLALARARE